MTPELIAEVRRNLGLDVPLPQQYLSYIGRVIRGDLGKSIWTGQPVWREMQGQWPSTLELTLASMGTAVVLGVTLGTLAAVRRGTWVDSTVMGTTARVRSRCSGRADPDLPFFTRPARHRRGMETAPPARLAPPPTIPLPSRAWCDRRR
jgi:hypothetical protein